MKQLFHIMFVLFLACSYTNQCFGQPSDDFEWWPEKEEIQRSYNYTHSPLVRQGGQVYLKDENGEYWMMDTTKVMVFVDTLMMPKDTGWEMEKYLKGFAKVPVPEGTLIEDFAASLWDLPWVVTVDYETYAKFAGDPMAIQKTIAKKDKQFSSGCYDLTGRPASTPFRGIYVRDGKKVLVK